MIKAILLHLSMNMWEDVTPEEAVRNHPDFPEALYPRCRSDQLRCDEALWDDTVRSFAANSGNMLVIDLGDGVAWQRHPEIGVHGAWSVDKLKEKIRQARALGLEVIPKVNFSSCHDAWMKDYSRRLSTPEYYRFCSDIIGECVEYFDTPRFLHIGMDEEDYPTQRYYEYVTVRQGALWWKDLHFYIDEVEKHRVRPWMWSDVLWHKSDGEFEKYVPKSVVQSNWYYWKDFERKEREEYGDGKAVFDRPVDAYLRLDAMGYDQIPTGSNLALADNYTQTVDFCRTHLRNPDHILGFLTTPWVPTLEAYRANLLNACLEVKNRA